MKKYVRYYLAKTENAVSYRRLESDLPFSIQEGKDQILIDKDINSVQTIAKSKAEMFLGLGNN